MRSRLPLFLSLATASLLACPAVDTVPNGDSGADGSTMTTSSSGTSEESTDSSDSTEGESSESAGDPCDGVDCGGGICTPEGEESVTCVCGTGYIVEEGVPEPAPCVRDDNCVEVRTLECRTSVPEGSAVGMLFSVSYCNGEPYLDLPIGDLAVEEKQGAGAWEELLPTESSQTFVDGDFTHHVYLLIDVSDSIQDTDGALASLQTSVSDFVDTLEAQTTPVRFSVFLFDGDDQLYTFLPDTGDFAAAKTQVAGLGTASGTDSASTNLYGAVIEGIDEIERIQDQRKLASERGVVTAGTIVVVSDGDDEAGRKTLEQVQARIDGTKANVIVMGYGPEENYPTLLTLGRDGAFIANNNDGLDTAFEALGERISTFTQSTYFMGYCSPKRGGEALVRAFVRNPDPNEPVLGAAECPIDASFFDDGCTADTFIPANACTGQECGGLVGCGTCGVGDCCVEGQCQGISTRRLLPEGTPAFQPPCNDHYQCAPGLTCSGGSCVLPKPVDTACGPCEYGVTWCNPIGNICRAVGTLGDQCTSYLGCDTLHCAQNPDTPTDPNKYCSVRPRYGETCEATGEDGTWCPSNGAECASDLYRYEQCQTGVQCRSGVCFGFPVGVTACESTGVCYYDSPIIN